MGSRDYVGKDRRIIEMNINEKKKKGASKFRCNCRRARATNNGSQFAVLAEKGLNTYREQSIRL